MWRVARVIGWIPLAVVGGSFAIQFIWLEAPLRGPVPYELSYAIVWASGHVMAMTLAAVYALVLIGGAALGALTLVWPGLVVIGLIALDAWMRAHRVRRMR